METVNTNDKGVKFVVSLAGASDKNADSRFMIEQNHSPAILVEDGLSTLLPTLEITLHASFCVQDMLERRVTDSGVWVRDSQLGEWKQVPTVQIYVLGYPCTPWSLWHAWKQVNHFTQIVDDFVKVVGSFFFRWCIYQYLSHNLLWICFSLMFVSVLVSPLRRGKGKGFQDPAAKPLFAGIKTLRLTKPKLWVFECVEAMAARSTESTGTALTDGKKAQHDLEASAISLWFAT